MSKIKIGTEVTWESQVRGQWNTKTGVVKKHLPPGADARLVLPKGTKPSRLQTRTPTSNHDRHLVEAIDRNDKKVYFTARTSTLQAALDGTYVRPTKKKAAKKTAKKAKASGKAAKKASPKAAKKTKAKASGKKTAKAKRTAPVVEVVSDAKPKRSRRKAAAETEVLGADVDVARVEDDFAEA